MQLAISIIARAAAADVHVLLRGETGTGKGVLARTLHAQSRRSGKPFITVNCPSLSDDLLISEMFGHAKGSFTGAIRDKAGLVDAAEGGTLFLDELGDLSPTVQAKLLRFIQDRAYERLGETTTRIADVRIVAATNRDLDAQVKAGHFREDLLYRLNVVEVLVPPLRERRADIIDLARHFLGIASAHLPHPTVLSPGAEMMLTAYAWPGNIRELCNEVQRVIVLWPSQTIEAENFSSRLVPVGAPGPILGDRHSLATIENEHIRLVLSKADRLHEAAAILGIQLSTLWRKRRKLELSD
jgi:NtrC-family two-component system response regulator AlgB